MIYSLFIITSLKTCIIKVYYRKDLPVVYARIGKSSPSKNDENINFTIKELQKVFDHSLNPGKGKFIWKWMFMNNKEKIPPYYIPYDETDHTLVFESRFESGNLDYAIKISDNEYNLLLQNDTLSFGHTQWFYFKVSNTRKNKVITFNIVNFVIYIEIHSLKKVHYTMME